MEQVWKKTLSLLKSEVNEQVFSVWFQPIKQIGLEDNTIILAVPNKFFESWIKEKYMGLLTSSLSRASGKDLAVRFEYVPTDPSAPVDPAAGKIDEKTVLPETAEKPGTIKWLKNVFEFGQFLHEN